jgi:integrase
MSDEKQLRRVRGSGSIFRKGTSRTWTIQYYKDDPATGKRVRAREYTSLTSRAEAQRLLNTRLYQVDRGELFDTRKRGARIEELFLAMKENCLNNRREDAAARLAWQWEEHLKTVFANVLAANLTTDAVTGYTRQRQQEGAANATINRELSALRRMFKLGTQCTPPKVRVVPHIPMLKEDNTRRGFVEDADFSRLAAEASELWLRTFLELAFTYGWRKGELLGLRVRQVNLPNRTIRLDPGTTKNRQGREVAMTGKVEELLRLALAGKGPEKFVLTRANGSRVRDFRTAWYNLCVRAGLGEFVQGKYRGLIIHDLRRSAAKALRRAGVPESVIMATGGWKTAAMFRRYAIDSSADQRDAVELLEKKRAEAVSPRSAPFDQDQPKGGPEAERGKVQ